VTDSTCTPDDCGNRGPRGGLCRECQKAKALRRYYARPEEYAANNKRWREENPDRNRERIRRWFEENGDRRRTYLDEHRDEANEKNRARRAANPGADTEYSRRWREANPEKFALKNREASRRRQTGTTASRVAYAAVLQRDGMVCHICGGDIPSLADLHFDHVIPLAKGGPHSAENIRPAHALCNLRKSDKLI
jgi:5-methylcytosine-specific restriction endonuclease McrA